MMISLILNGFLGNRVGKIPRYFTMTIFDKKYLEGNKKFGKR